MALLNHMDLERLARGLPYDLDEPKCSPREIAEAVVNDLEYFLRKNNSRVYLAIERERRRNRFGALKKLIILTPAKNTVVIPMTSSSSLLTIGKKAMFLGYQGSSKALLDELIREIEAAIERADAVQPAS